MVSGGGDPAGAIDFQAAADGQTKQKNGRHDGLPKIQLGVFSRGIRVRRRAEQDFWHIRFMEYNIVMAYKPLSYKHT